MVLRVSIENFFPPTLRVQATKINPKSIPRGCLEHLIICAAEQNLISTALFLAPLLISFP